MPDDLDIELPRIPRLPEVLALIRKLESRAKKNRDKDLAQASTLLRILAAIMIEPGQMSAEIVDLDSRRGAPKP